MIVAPLIDDFNVSDAAEITIFKSQVSKCLSVIDEKLTHKTIIAMQASTKNPLYQITRTHCNPEFSYTFSPYKISYSSNSI
jgi:hypothetical protein